MVRQLNSTKYEVSAYLRAQPMPTKMMMRQTARPTNEIETISRTTMSTNNSSASAWNADRGRKQPEFKTVNNISQLKIF